MADDRKKVSPEQLNILIEAIEKDPTLMSSRGGGKALKMSYLDKWEILAKKLNSVDNGALKNVTKWQQALRDCKSNTKKKASKAASEGAYQDLTSLELRILSLFDGEQPDVKSGGIDISNITELDPLSSDDDSQNDQNGLDAEPLLPDMLTVYTNVKREDKNSSHPEDTEVNIKRRRIRMFSEEGTNQQTTDILSRLTALEASRQETDKHHNTLLEAMVSALNRQADQSAAQTHALNRLVELLERRERDS